MDGGAWPMLDPVGATYILHVAVRGLMCRLIRESVFIHGHCLQGCDRGHFPRSYQTMTENPAGTSRSPEVHPRARTNNYHPTCGGHLRYILVGNAPWTHRRDTMAIPVRYCQARSPRSSGWATVVLRTFHCDPLYRLVLSIVHY